MNNNDKNSPGVPDTASTLPASSNLASGHEKDIGMAKQDPVQEGEPKPMSTDMQKFIGRQLRAVYDDIARQPVPDRFLELMKQLETKTSTG